MKLCTDPTHKDTPALAIHGDTRRQCPLCGGERLAFNPPDEDVDIDAVFRRGSPKTPEAAAAAFNAMVEHDARTDGQIREHFRHYAQRGILSEAEAREAEIRAELTRRVQAALEHTVDNGEYGDASGHLGGDGFTAMAEAAVDAFADYYRGRSA